VEVRIGRICVGNKAGGESVQNRRKNRITIGRMYCTDGDLSDYKVVE
jgi:hypothetical protein